ncbi:MAG: GAF domain-containing protein [Candidatus Hydrogenedentes bacterium]|nr:GAF domain-containing protein [Candidatus Hydrogenedentota bacterium]
MTQHTLDTAAWLHEIAPDDLRRTVDVLYRVHRLVVLVTDLPTLLLSIMEESKQVAQAEACALMLYDAITEDLYFEVALGESGDQSALKREVRLKLGQGIAGSAALTRQSVSVADARTDDRFFKQADETSGFETRSLLAVPLVDRDALIGVLEVVNKVGGGPFTNADLHVMEMFGSLVATSIANARLIEQNLRAERLAAIGQAVAGLSHYTKNIITGLSGSVDLIDQGLSQNNSEFILRSWPIFKRSTQKISDFVEDMLSFSKPRKPLIEPFDVRTVVKDVSDTVSGTVAKKEIGLHIDCARAAPTVRADQRGLYRVLLNLVSNAADAVPRTNGVIRLHAETADSGALIIEVADNGPGVPDEIARQIFDPFFSTKGSRGTGLGLAVTQKIVVEHGGQITVSRAPDGGALFRVVIPQEVDGQE